MMGLYFWIELAGVSKSFYWSWALPLGICPYFLLIPVTISEGYKTRVNFVWASWEKKEKHPLGSWYYKIIIQTLFENDMRKIGGRGNLFFRFQINGRV